MAAMTSILNYSNNHSAFHVILGCWGFGFGTSFAYSLWFLGLIQKRMHLSSSLFPIVFSKGLSKLGIILCCFLVFTVHITVISLQYNVFYKQHLVFSEEYLRVDHQCPLENKIALNMNVAWSFSSASSWRIFWILIVLVSVRSIVPKRGDKAALFVCNLYLLAFCSACFNFDFDSLPLMHSLQECFLQLKHKLVLNHLILKHSIPNHEGAKVLLASSVSQFGLILVLLKVHGVVSSHHITEEDEYHNSFTLVYYGYHRSKEIAFQFLYARNKA